MNPGWRRNSVIAVVEIVRKCTRRSVRQREVIIKRHIHWTGKRHSRQISHIEPKQAALAAGMLNGITGRVAGNDSNWGVNIWKLVDPAFEMRTLSDEHKA